MHQYAPGELRLILVDPKRVEFDGYDGSPYLLSNVITDTRKALKSLKWCLKELDRRFDVLQKAECRNIRYYNESAKVKMPYIVYVIDELADLMVVAPKQFEEAIIRIAQMARAVGIHIIIATQRPCEDVITGMIKANMPARVAFSVASKEDSIIVMDRGGAEKLLGRGDSLYMDAEMPKPIRLKTPYISEEDVNKVKQYLVGKGREYNLIDAIDSSMPDYEDDVLLEEAKKAVLESRKASASFIQRKLRIGYARAASILDQLEEEGVIGPSNGAAPRDIYLNRNE